MSKYGPTWVWPATGQSSRQVPPLPGYSKERSDSHPLAHLHPTSRLSGSCAESVNAFPRLHAWPEAWLGSQEGEVVATASGKKKSDAKGLEITQARNLPHMPEGSHTTLLHQSGRVHRMNGAGNRNQ